MESQAPTPRIYSVNELTLEIQGLIEKKFDFVWLEGEISNFSAPLSGHYYMVLKDDKAQIKAVMFRPQIRYLRFMPENGMKILARGRIGIYAPRGEYQLVMDYLEPLGAGALAVAFEQLKKKLAAEPAPARRRRTSAERAQPLRRRRAARTHAQEIGRASCRERV